MSILNSLKNKISDLVNLGRTPRGTISKSIAVVDEHVSDHQRREELINNLVYYGRRINHLQWVIRKQKRRIRGLLVSAKKDKFGREQ